MTADPFAALELVYASEAPARSRCSVTGSGADGRTAAAAALPSAIADAPAGCALGADERQPLEATLAPIGSSESSESARGGLFPTVVDSLAGEASRLDDADSCCCGFETAAAAAAGFFENFSASF